MTAKWKPFNKIKQFAGMAAKEKPFNKIKQFGANWCSLYER